MNSPAPAPVATQTRQDPVKDRITGLLSEQYFCRRLDRFLGSERAARMPVTLALLQLENFYEIRTWVGKSEAEMLLGDIAATLVELVPAGSRLCRCRNHEFAVLLWGDGSRRAALIGERIRVAAQQLAGHAIPPQLKLVCGIGFAVVDSLSHDTSVLFARARQNLAQRQSLGLRHQSRAVNRGHETAAVLGALMRALENQGLCLYFQALVALDDPGLPHYQLSVRLPVADTLLEAGDFIDIAVQFALGETLDRWMLEQALRLLAEDRSGRLCLTIHLTQNSLASRNFPQWLQNHRGLASPLARRLVFQISEIDLLICQHHLPQLSEVFEALDLRLCISRFGSTPNPARYLGLLKAAQVSLDPGLVEAAQLDLSTRRQLADMVAGLRGRGIRVQGSRCENLRIVPWLWQIGVRTLQGHALHRPAPQADYRFIDDLHL